MALSLHNHRMKKILPFIVFILLQISVKGQEENTRGTIKVQKKGLVTKVVFDDVNYRLIGIDQYGNVLDSAVVEFQMSFTIKGVFYSDSAAGPALTPQMRQLLGKSDRTTKIFFDGIKVKNRNGNVQKMPKFNYTFGYSDEGNQ